MSEIKYSMLNDDHRIDAEYFGKNILDTLEKLSDFGTLKIGDIANVTDGIHDSIDYDENSPINLISATSPKENVFDLSRGAFISEKAHKQNPRTALRKNDVIISTVGTIGNCAVVDDSILPANSDRHVGIIRIKNDYSPYVLSTFLLSKYGKIQTSREATGNVQLNLFIYKLKELEIPQFFPDFQSKIEQTVKSAHAKLAESKSLYAEAEDILLLELGLKNWHPRNTNINVKKLKESFLQTGRLDSEYYLPRYEDYAHLIEHYRGGYGQFSNVCMINEANYVPAANEKYTYIELGNIGSYGNITDCTVAYGKDLPSRARRVVHTNNVILSSVGGSLQSCALISSEYDNAICSTGFFVVRSNAINSETLLTLFKSEVMQNLLKQSCSGTILTAINHTELQKIVVPKIRKEVQDKIAENIQKSIALRNKSKSLLENAKVQVENVIQTGGYKTLLEQSLYYFRLAEWLLLQELFLDYWQSRGSVSCSIKSFSAVQSTGRLDSEYYQPKYDELFEHLAKYKCTKLGDIVAIKKSIEPGSDSYIEEGIPFIRVSDVNKFEIGKTDLHLSPKEFNIEVLRPHKDTIIFSKDGSIGIAYKCEKNLDIITSGALLHLDIRNENILPDYLTIVLNSIVTQLQAERDSNGAIIQHWKLDDIKKIIVPILPMQIQSLIAEKVQKSFALRKQSKRLLEQAKRMVEEEIEKKENR